MVGKTRRKPLSGPLLFLEASPIEYSINLSKEGEKYGKVLYRFVR
jgi:hypothetical protein